MSEEYRTSKRKQSEILKFLSDNPVCDYRKVTQQMGQVRQSLTALSDAGLIEIDTQRVLMVCHYCGYEQPLPKICPSCGSKYLGGFKAGTQKIEMLVQQRFPQARVMRMDFDTTHQGCL